MIFFIRGPRAVELGLRVVIFCLWLYFCGVRGRALQAQGSIMGVVPLKDDDDFKKHNMKAVEAAASELRGFVGDIEAIEAQLADMNRDRKDIYVVAKSKGFDVKALRRLIAERKRDVQDLADERAAVEQYRDLLL